MRSGLLAAVGAGAAAAAGGLFRPLTAAVERRLNTVAREPPPRPSDRARRLHETLLIADLHADSLLWGRDLLRRGARGHADVPRLIEGNVALQVFGVVTKAPRRPRLEGNDDRADAVRLLALAGGWPLATWGSLRARALYQAARLHRMAAASRGRLVVVGSAADLRTFPARRGRDGEAVAGLLSLEGAQALEGDPANVDALYEAGFRLMSLAHFSDNDVAGSSTGLRRGGLTPLGRAVVRRMEARRMVVDLAHASARAIEDVLAAATRPVVVSHTGVRGTCDNDRNLTDDQVRGVASTGGLIGIGYWEWAVGREGAGAVARAIRYAARVAGVRHVALGSDFDGATCVPFDAAGLVALTEALLQEGTGEDEARLIMGENVLRFLQETL